MSDRPSTCRRLHHQNAACEVCFVYSFLLSNILEFGVAMTATSSAQELDVDGS